MSHIQYDKPWANVFTSIITCSPLPHPVCVCLSSLYHSLSDLISNILSFSLPLSYHTINHTEGLLIVYDLMPNKPWAHLLTLTPLHFSIQCGNDTDAEKSFTHKTEIKVLSILGLLLLVWASQLQGLSIWACLIRWDQISETEHLVDALH